MDYSLDFLKTDWTCAGLDLQFQCDFVDTEFDVVGVNRFLEGIGKDCSFDSYVSDQPASEVSEWVPTADSDDRRPFLKTLPITNIMWLRESHHRTPPFFIRIYPPDTLEVGAEPEYFYSGSLAEDRRRVEILVGIVSWGCEIYGDAIAEFAADGWTDRLVQERREANKGPNLTQETDWNHWIDYAVHACNDTREAWVSISPSS